MKEPSHEIYVALLDEGVDVWRPVTAIKVSEGVYQIAEQPYDRDVEKWEFEPGDVVLAEMTIVNGGQVLAAKNRFQGGT